MARLGGLARAAALTKKERIEAARKAGQGNLGKKRKQSNARVSPERSE
jgi:hypothetical protein